MNVVPVENKTNYVNDTSKSNDNLSTEQFLKVLLTQLEHQNPLEPMNDVEYISQMVQFSVLEGINSLNQEMHESKALDYIGKDVLGRIDYEDGESQMVSGLVKSVSYVGKKVLLNLDSNSAVYLSNVLEVK